MAPTGYYQLEGKTYREKTHVEVNAGFSLDEVQDYVRSLSEDSVSLPREPDAEVPHASIMDYIATPSQLWTR